MYLHNRQLMGSVGRRDEGSITLRRSQRFHYPERTQLQHPFSPQLERAPRYSYRLGEATVPPKGLILFDHFQVPKKKHPGFSGIFFRGSVTKMAASDLNPGFIDASDNLITDTSSNGLQTCLHKLITTQFQNYLSNESNTAPSAGDRLRVALVDLTGDKIADPDFAGWGSTVSMYGASVPKILALYAAHQLRADLRRLAADQKISDGKALEKIALQTWKLNGNVPNLGMLFGISKWSGAPNSLDFTKDALRLFDGIKHNAEASELIIRVGFPYIASVTWQAGLHHPTRGGLWLTTSYGSGNWGSNPVKGVNSANVTALSVATYFTLLAQGRLVDEFSSAQMRNWLQKGCVVIPYFPLADVIASKCGIWSDYLHDCALIVRDGLKYVVVGLTRTKPSEYAKYTQLFLELHKLIVRNNQTPRQSC